MEAPLGVWIPRWCSEGGAGDWAADARRSHLASAAWKERRWRGQQQQKNNEKGRSTGACLHSLISFHCLPLPWPSCLMNFPTLSSWLFSLKSCCVLVPGGFSVPLCFPSVKHIIKTHSFQKVIYTLIRLYIKYLGIFKGKQKK